MPIINGQWVNPAMRQCDGKEPYRTIRYAQGVARRDSERTGHLIIAYQCYICHGFHVGHADLSQQIVFAQRVAKVEKQQKAAARRKRRRLKQQRKAAQQQGHRPPLPSECPVCTGPVPEDRWRAAWDNGSITVYCSITCKHEAARKRSEARGES